MNSFRFLGCRSIAEVNAMTIEEYEWRMFARKLSDVDEEQKRHHLAYLNVVAQSTDKNGKPKFKEFVDFYDYEGRIKAVMEGEGIRTSKLSAEKVEELKTIAKRRKNFRERRGTI